MSLADDTTNLNFKKDREHRGSYQFFLTELHRFNPNRFRLCLLVNLERWNQSAFTRLIQMIVESKVRKAINIIQ